MKSINEYNNSVLNICQEFGNKYFEESDWDIIGNINVWYWPVEVSDYFFSIDNVACALHNNIPKDILLKRYNTCLEKWKVETNLYNYYLTKNGLSPL